jgi:SAM-dependent methyltransferase
MTPENLLHSDRFPRASKYQPDWIIAGISGAANSLWLTEWLTEVVDLKPGKKVLDLGCGRGNSSVFLSREFGVQVWSTDLWFDASERLHRIRDAGVEETVFPIHADARALPFAAEFFDAIISVDSFMYFGTDDLYLNYLARFVKPGGPIAVVASGLTQEFPGEIPAHLKQWWEPSMACLHSVAWWKKHWDRPSIVDIDHADTMPDGWKVWLDWQRVICPENKIEIEAIEADQGQHIGYFRIVGHRKPSVKLDEPITGVPVEYKKAPLLRPKR